MQPFQYAGNGFTVSYASGRETAASAYKLHNHENCMEILVFLKGKSSFYVEGAVYPLTKNDVVIARNDEMHRVIHHADAVYERVIINFGVTFLKDNGCENYGEIFLCRRPGEGNHFAGKTVLLETGDILHRLLQYAGEGCSEALVKGVLLEYLRALHALSDKATKSKYASRRLQEIMAYLNDNITSPVSLDDLARRFYISKYYLCRLFREQTGFTVTHYITHKRLLLVRELAQAGYSLTDAALAAGFGDYSSFYLACKKQTGKPPRSLLL